MPDRDALAGLRQALAAIEVMMRSGRFDTARLAELAREARRHSDTVAQVRRAGGPQASHSQRETIREEQPVG